MQLKSSLLRVRHHARRLRRCLPATLLLAALLLFGSSAPSGAELLGHGPVLAGGWSGDEDASGSSQNLGILLAGWRWHFDGADFLDDFFAKGHIDFSWTVEPLLGAEFGDAEAFEASLVPYARFAPAGWDGVVPFLEGGIGIAYTGLRNYGLGSSVTLSDNIGAGLAFGSGDGLRWSVAYRFRHLSHAGILSEHNDGLNAHFLVLTIE